MEIFFDLFKGWIELNLEGKKGLDWIGLDWIGNKEKERVKKIKEKEKENKKEKGIKKIKKRIRKYE